MISGNLKIRDRLLLTFLVVFIPLMIAGSGISYFKIKKVLMANIEKELNEKTDALVKMIKASASVSIKNRLCAIAEKNLDIAEYYYNKYRSGLLIREEAIKMIEEVFLSQSVGISGYIYCIDSNATVVVHPNNAVKGSDVSSFDFVRKQIEIKDGYIEYNWQNPGEPYARPKALYMTYFKPLDWIISVSSYRNEFNYLIDIDDFKEIVISYKSGKTGYAFIIREDGIPVVHPAADDLGHFKRNNSLYEVILQIINIKKGTLRYSWKNPGEKFERKKIAIFDHLPEYKWIVGSSSYVEEIYEPLDIFKRLILIILLIAISTSIILTYIISRLLTRPLEVLMKKLESGVKGDFSIRMNYNAPNEFGKLSEYFDSFMDRLDLYHKNLNKEICNHIKTQKSLKEKELKLRGLFDQLFQFSGVLSPSGIIQDVNQTALDLIGCSALDVKNRFFWETPWWNHDAEVQRKLKKSIELAGKGEFVRYNTSNITQTGDVRNIDISIKPVLDEFGNVLFLIVEGRDITELKVAEQEKRAMTLRLQKAQKMESIGTLAGGIAHDFNNILSAIFGYNQLAMLHLSDPEKLSIYLDKIDISSKRAGELVKQILTFSRNTEHKKQPLQVSSIVMEALKMIRSTIPSTIDIKSHISTNSVILGDSTQIHQIMMNLCTNAYHAMEETGGVISVTLERTELPDGSDVAIFSIAPIEPGMYIKLTVHDTGKGMDKETMEKIFEPYFTTKAVNKGTGLGMAVVHGIVAGHNGYIDLTSEVGRGTQISIYLPVFQSSSALNFTEPEPVVISGGNEFIMVVDDEESIITSTKELLKDYGYRVKVFSNGVDALLEYKQNFANFDLIITDVTMPKMTGVELAKRILEIKPDQPIIICTGHSDLIDAEKAAAMGICEYYEKPLIAENLIKVIRKVLDEAKFSA
ncbi:putative Histidine kinase [Desulfamplus magnetovallimortis]|uniref:histidine kinase n=1 Tax=Desulfamplus magnetovallimortis TaxID=1246637 RepID=L0R760_9BACT|nr:cache domain-containing protein [Desulfamplus magnetovallimortis]CCO06801.1 putative Histidine kinase [Desulfamplus magnetovallimortis BW-1]SLM32852.1 putative Histidine kinase [Desulfamplus magnetovallimortis]